MHTRPFGKSGRQVTEVGLGAWQLGGDCWGDIDQERAMQILHTAVDSGVRFIDTADVYGLGQSEHFIGAFLKECTEDLFVATKIGRFPKPGWPDNFSFESFRTHTEASLARLGIEALDLTQLHSIPTEHYERAEVFGWLETLQQQGKIKHWGVSVESMHEAEICMKQPGITSLQIIFNIFRQKPIQTIFETAKDRQIALIIRLPLASGLLAGKFTAESKFADNDHRGFNPDGQMFNVGETFAGLGLAKGSQLADQLKPLVPDNMTMAQMALRWILDHDAVTVVIPGASNPDQARSNAAVSDLPALSPALHNQLSKIYQEQVVQHIRGPY